MDSKRSLLEPLFARFDIRDPLSEAERDFLIANTSEERRIAARSPLGHEGHRPTHCAVLIDGIAARTIHTVNGTRRIVGFLIAGDFIDLQAFPLQRLDHGVEAISDCRIVQIPHSALLQATETFPHLTRLLWQTTLVEGSMHRQWLSAMGAMDAGGQMAHLFCEQFMRARSVGMAQGNSFHFPITQEQLASALGLSIVHVNRTLQRLRGMGLIRWQGQEVEVTNWPGLKHEAQFDPAYLHLDRAED